MTLLSVFMAILLGLAVFSTDLGAVHLTCLPPAGFHEALNPSHENANNAKAHGVMRHTLHILCEILHCKLPSIPTPDMALSLGYFCMRSFAYHVTMQ